MLSDPEKRQIYDKTGLDGLDTANAMNNIDIGALVRALFGGGMCVCVCVFVCVCVCVCNIDIGALVRCLGEVYICVYILCICVYTYMYLP